MGGKFRPESPNIVGLNYGVLPRSIVHALGSKIIDDKLKIFAVVANSHDDYDIDIDKYGIFYSSDNGKTWNKSLAYDYDEGVFAERRLYVSPHNNELWYFSIRDNVSYFSEDGGKGWKLMSDFSFYYLSDFDFHPSQPNVKYICASGSLYRYDQKTENKMDLKINAARMIVSQDDDKKLLATQKKKLMISTDGGWTWNDITQNLKNVVSFYRCEPISFNSNTITLFVDPPFNKSPHIALSKNLGSSWEIVRTLNIGIVHFVYVSPFDANNIFLVTTVPVL